MSTVTPKNNIKIPDFLEEGYSKKDIKIEILKNGIEKVIIDVGQKSDEDTTEILLNNNCYNLCIPLGKDTNSDLDDSSFKNLQNLINDTEKFIVPEGNTWLRGTTDNLVISYNAKHPNNKISLNFDRYKELFHQDPADYMMQSLEIPPTYDEVIFDPYSVKPSAPLLDDEENQNLMVTAKLQPTTPLEELPSYATTIANTPPPPYEEHKISADDYTVEATPIKEALAPPTYVAQLPFNHPSPTTPFERELPTYDKAILLNNISDGKYIIFDKLPSLDPEFTLADKNFPIEKDVEYDNNDDSLYELLLGNHQMTDDGLQH